MRRSSVAAGRSLRLLLSKTLNRARGLFAMARRDQWKQRSRCCILLGLQSVIMATCVSFIARSSFSMSLHDSSDGDLCVSRPKSECCYLDRANAMAFVLESRTSPRRSERVTSCNLTLSICACSPSSNRRLLKSPSVQS
jgi:hypothetical protein